ncbi:MAG: sugar ABC transporter substrate-binding protein [Planctomycetota bacterium]|nr:MAG: sugar ABC transporter substrate-binding protein [Planctomycetota bacterium]
MSRFLPALLLFVAIFVGCGKPEGRPNRDKLLLAVIPKATSHEYWKSVHAGVVHGRDEAEVDVVWKGPLTEGDRETQINLVQDFIAQGVDGICLAPLDSQALAPVVREARQSGIPVLIFDSGLDDETNIVSFVATDNYRAGQIAGRHLAELLMEKGRVIILRQAPGSQSAEQREQGCIDVLTEEFPGIEIVSSSEYAGDTADKALVKSQQLLQTFGDEFDGVFAASQHVSMGMLRALEEQGLAGNVKFVGIDSGPQLLDALRAGKMHAIVLQDPVGMGKAAVTTLASHLRGSQVPARVSTGETLATRQNMERPEIRQLLEPELYE